MFNINPNYFSEWLILSWYIQGFLFLPYPYDVKFVICGQYLYSFNNFVSNRFLF